jgi:hypothetical protein
MKKIRHSFSIAVAGYVVLAVTSVSHANPVAINNHSFEDPTISDGAFVTSGPGTGTLNSWSFAVDNGGSFEDFGIENPGGGAYTGATGAGTPAGADGINVAFLNQDNEGLVTTVFQNVGALQANTVYTLTVAIGQRLDRVNGPVEIALLNAATGATDVFATGTILNSTTGVSGTNGAFEDFTATFATGALVSNDLYIGARFLETADNFIQGSVDNFRLDATAVPEPTSFLMVGSALGSVLLFSRKHKECCRRAS